MLVKYVTICMSMFGLVMAKPVQSAIEQARSKTLVSAFCSDSIICNGSQDARVDEGGVAGLLARVWMGRACGVEGL